MVYAGFLRFPLEKYMQLTVLVDVLTTCRVGFVTMRFSSRNRCFLVLLLLAQIVAFASAQDDQAVTSCDPRCKTGVCDGDTCRCVLPTADRFDFLG